MARPIRIQYPGATYHVISRGIERREIFKTDADYLLFKKIFIEVIKRYNWECYAYCLMPNHYHLLIKTLDPNLSIGMCQLNSDYSQKYNIRHSRVGHLLQGRYKAILVEEKTYKNKLIRYITLNPVKAGLVSSLGDWHWSSYHELFGKSESENCVDKRGALNQFGNDIAEAKKVYKEYLGDNSLSEMHIHYSGIEYTEKGERRHLPLKDSDANWQDFVQVLKERKVNLIFSN